MYALWIADRAAALVTYWAMALSVITGVLYRVQVLGVLARASKHLHVPASVLATLGLLAHGVMGLIDAVLVWTGEAPEPAYGMRYLMAGVAVGIGALWVTLVGVFGFLDAKRFKRPWDPRTVHLFTYGGFVFGSLHAVAIGSDVGAVMRALMIGATVLIVYTLLLRMVLERPSRATGRASGPPSGP